MGQFSTLSTKHKTREEQGQVAKSKENSWPGVTLELLMITLIIKNSSVTPYWQLIVIVIVSGFHLSKMLTFHKCHKSLGSLCLCVSLKMFFAFVFSSVQNRSIVPCLFGLLTLTITVSTTQTKSSDPRY